MKTYLKFFLILAFSTLLNACIEVEEDNSDVADAIERQNQILDQQNETSIASVTLYGSVYDIPTDENVDAEVRVKVGTTWLDSVSTTNGEFEVSGVSPNSNYELVVSSSTGAFLTRAMFGVSRENSAGNALQNIGGIGVSEGITRSFSILNDETGEPVLGIELKGSSSIPISSFFGPVIDDDYVHISTYNESTSTYDIVLPEYIDLSISASLDLDNDGQVEYENSSSFSQSNELYLSASQVKNPSEIRLTPVQRDLPDLELRVTVIDDSAEAILGLSLTGSDDSNDEIVAVFDENTDQYVIDTELDQRVEVLIPAFEVGESVFGSASISVYRSGDLLRVSSSGSQDNYSYNLPEVPAVIDLVIQPREIIPSSLLEIVASSEELSASNGYRVFYSNSVILPEGSVALYREDGVTVVRGSDSDDDLVPDGTTSIQREDVAMSATAELSLNNTLLTITPDASLPSGGEFRFEVGEVVDESTGVSTDFNGDQFSFSVEVEEAFEIADIVLDNNNYLNDNEVLVPTNTAGEVSSPSTSDRSVLLYFPRSIEGLTSLTLVKRLITEGSSSSAEVRNYTVVSEGNVFTSGLRYAVTLAENENLSSNISVLEGTTLLGGEYYYSVSISEFMSDHTDSEVNTVAFDYLLERDNGDVETGTLVLEVQ